jgi:membrane protein DedA with SNARE-associated domain
VAGAWTGISGSYLLGRTLGVGAVHRYGKYVRLTETRLAKVHMWFDRIGHWMLFVGYYIAGLRHFTAVVAGMSRVAYPTFIAYAWSGGALWVGSFLTLGYFLGENWLRVAELVHRYVGIASIAIMALAALWFAVWYALKEKKTKNPAKTRP